MDNSLINKVFQSKNSGDFIVKKYLGEGKGYYLIEFILTGKTMKTNKYNIKNGNVKDYYYPRLEHVGYLGEQTLDKSTKIYTCLYSRWKSILSRCYNKKAKDYRSYGEKGIKVDQSWMCFYNFYNDVLKIKGFDEDLVISNKLQLDKDMKNKNSKCYSKNNCLWVDSSINNKFKPSQRRKVEIIHPDGEVEIIENVREMCRKYGLTHSNVVACLSGKQKTHKKYRFKYLDSGSNYHKQ